MLIAQLKSLSFFQPVDGGHAYDAVPVPISNIPICWLLEQGALRTLLTCSKKLTAYS